MGHVFVLSLLKIIYFTTDMFYRSCVQFYDACEDVSSYTVTWSRWRGTQYDCYALVSLCLCYPIRAGLIQRPMLLTNRLAHLAAIFFLHGLALVRFRLVLFVEYLICRAFLNEIAGTILTKHPCFRYWVFTLNSERSVVFLISTRLFGG